MPNPPVTNFKDSDGVDLGTKFVTNEYLMGVYPQIVNQNITGTELWVLGRYPEGYGVNKTTLFSTPVTTFAGLSNWKTLYFGNGNRIGSTYAIKTDGSLWGWGYNNCNLLGQVEATTGTSSKLTPVPISFGSASWANVKWKSAVSTTNVNNVLVGFDMAWGIKDDDTLWTWGSNAYQFNGAGIPGTAVVGTYFTTPVTVAGGGTWRSITCGSSNLVYGIKTDGTLWTWGYNGYSEPFGTGDGRAIICTPVTTFAGGNNWKDVSTSGRTTAALKNDGTLWVWGAASGAQGSVSFGTFDTQSKCTPVTTFAGGTDWKQVSAGDGCIAAIKTDGSLWTWGTNGYGQLGINSSGNPTDAANRRCTPVTTFAGGYNWKKVVVYGGGGQGDGTHSGMYALKTDGSLWCWGKNHRGQLGLNFANIRICTPVTTFAGGTKWKDIVINETGCYFIKSTAG